MKKVIFSGDAPKPIGPYSQAIRAGNFVFVSGQIPIDPSTNQVVEGNISTQTKVVMENIKSILKAEGYNMEDIVYITVYLREIKDFPQFNEEYSKYFKKDPPARVTVGVSDLPMNVKIEVSAIAYKQFIKSFKR